MNLFSGGYVGSSELSIKMKMYVEEQQYVRRGRGLS